MTDEEKLAVATDKLEQAEELCKEAIELIAGTRRYYLYDRSMPSIEIREFEREVWDK